VTSLSLQEILEKFEFFPIKCRIQRAMEVFEISKQEGSPGGTRFKTKVWTRKHPSGSKAVLLFF
jgi:hypothetical protein